MSDRFYNNQLRATGSCPGYNGKPKRNRKMAWTDEKREQAVELYEAANPTAENSMEIVKSIAEELEESPNGVRTILSKAGVYIKTTPAAKSGGSSTAKSGGTRVNKASAIEDLSNAIRDLGAEVDEEIVGKLTGKAAAYFTQVLNRAGSS